MAQLPSVKSKRSQRLVIPLWFQNYFISYNAYKQVSFLSTQWHNENHVYLMYALSFLNTYKMHYFYYEKADT